MADQFQIAISGSVHELPFSLLVDKISIKCTCIVSWCPCENLSWNCSILFSSSFLSYYSLSLTINWHVVSNLCCALSVSWFTLRTIFSELVICAVILPWVHDLVWHFQSTIIFIHFCCAWFTLRNLPLVWRLTRACLNNTQTDIYIPIYLNYLR